YDSLVVRAFQEIVARLVHVIGTVSIVLSVVYYAYPPMQLSRGPVMIWLFLGGLALLFWRRLFITLTSSAQMNDRTILLGDGPLTAPLATALSAHPEYGLKVIGYISREPVID